MTSCSIMNAELTPEYGIPQREKVRSNVSTSASRITDAMDAMDRQITRLIRLGEDDDHGFVPGTPASRIELVWPLTRELVSLSGQYNVEQRLQRHITKLSRRTV